MHYQEKSPWLAVKKQQIRLMDLDMEFLVKENNASFLESLSRLQAGQENDIT